jgi:hypothetical protein
MSTIFERDGRKILFVHIPKTGGSSVRKMLEKEGWKREDIKPIPPDFEKEIQTSHSGQSKHQHRELINLWKKDWEYEFAIVRNPYTRILSKAKRQAKEHGIGYPHPLGFIRWATDLFKNVIPNVGPGADDNHFRPQSEFIGEDTDWFRLEDQLPDLISELRMRKVISQSAFLPRLNVSFNGVSDTRMPWENYPDIFGAFLEFYKKDFEKFGYNKIYSTIYSSLI